MEFTTLAICLLATLVSHSLGQNSPEDYVNAHNLARAEAGVAPITWDTGLAGYALLNAAGKVISHNLNFQTIQQFGENVMLFSPDVTGAGAVEFWVGESQGYDKNHTCFHNNSEHYIQVIWPDSTQLGCARLLAGPVGDTVDGWIVECNYYPPANFTAARLCT